MSEVFLNDYIQKLILLEKQVGVKDSGQLLDPYLFNMGDIIEIQNGAAIIADFVGLKGLSFIVAQAKQERGVVGLIELTDQGNDVFIEISDKIKEFDAVILATLAHEITHKFLHKNGISCGNTPSHKYENEVLTDIASVYLGLGKLMLNGCEYKIVREEKIPEGIRKITKTVKSGYLNRKQLSVVYLLFCAMQQISVREYEYGLTTDALDVLWKCRKKYRFYLDEDFKKLSIENETIDLLQSSIRDTQSILSNIDRRLLYLQQAFLNVFENFLNSEHIKLRKLLSKAQEIACENINSQPLKYLNSIYLYREVARLESRLDNWSSELNQYLNIIGKVAKIVKKSDILFPKPSIEMFNKITCHNDGTRLRLPPDKAHIVAKCPKCHYHFSTGTSLPVFKNSLRIKIDFIFRKISKKVFKRKRKHLIF